MRVLIADDHPLFRDALSSAVGKLFADAELMHAATLGDAVEALRGNAIDLLLLDLHMADSEGFAGLAAVRHDWPALPVVVVSASEGANIVQQALAFGAAGYIPKSTPLDTICGALKVIIDGDIWAPPDALAASEAEPDTATEKLASLTPAQLKVLLGMREGRLNKQIAHDLGITEATVKAHVTAIFRKLDVINRTQAVLIAEKLDVDRPAER